MMSNQGGLGLCAHDALFLMRLFLAHIRIPKRLRKAKKSDMNLESFFIGSLMANPRQTYLIASPRSWTPFGGAST